jgi:hypothetical protein
LRHTSSFENTAFKITIPASLLLQVDSKYATNHVKKTGSTGSTSTSPFYNIVLL